MLLLHPKMSDPTQYKGILYPSTGILKYNTPNLEYGYRLVVEIDKDLVSYYRSLIPKHVAKPSPQMYAPHISVVRKEVPTNVSFWKKHQDKEIEFLYSNYINQGTVYFWLNVFSKELENIRLELGLPVSTQYTLPPEGFVKCFHITIGNIKA